MKAGSGCYQTLDSAKKRRRGEQMQEEGPPMERWLTLAGLPWRAAAKKGWPLAGPVSTEQTH